jgi:hypothetical protein
MSREVYKIAFNKQKQFNAQMESIDKHLVKNCTLGYICFLFISLVFSHINISGILSEENLRIYSDK